MIFMAGRNNMDDLVLKIEDVEKELATREEFEKEKKACKNCSNVEVFERDGKFIRKATYSHLRKMHMEATKHRFLQWLLNRRYLIEKVHHLQPLKRYQSRR